jgi:hypothetical protein
MMEQTKERRKLGWAILISLFLHLVIGYSLAAFGSAFTPTLPLEDKPVELTIVDLSATPPPLAPKDPPFMETAPSKESAEKPKEETFESNANSIAASKLLPRAIFHCPRRMEKSVQTLIWRRTSFHCRPTDRSRSPNRNQLSRRNRSLRLRQPDRNQTPRKRPSLHQSPNSSRC